MAFLTFLGDKEYIANVYPDEPVTKLWSLLKMNANEFTISSDKTPQVPLKQGSIGKISKGEDLTLVISKKGSETRIKSRGSANSKAASEKSTNSDKVTRKAISSTSKEGSHITNVNISISIDSHSSYGGRSKSESVRTDTKEPKSRKMPSTETLDRGDSGKLKVKKPGQESKRSTAGSQPSRESAGSRQSIVSPKGATQPQAGGMQPQGGGRSPGGSSHHQATAKVEPEPPKRALSFQSAFPPEITPQSRTRSLSKHLSVSSLHKTSFKGSARKLEVIHETDSKPKPLTSQGSKSTVPTIPSADVNISSNSVNKDAGTPTRNSSFSPEKKRSNNSAEGIAAFVVPTEASLPADAGATDHDSAKPQAVPEEVLDAKIPEGISSKQDIPVDVSAVAAEPSSLQIIEPLPRPPSGSSSHVVVQPKRSSDVEKTTKPQGETEKSPSPARDLQGEDVHTEMKNLVSSVILGIGAEEGTSVDPAKLVSTSDSPKRDSLNLVLPRKKSSEDKPILNRDDWHPDEEPPSIRRSDVDLTRLESDQPPVKPTDQQTAEPKPDPKKSYDTNDSEQIFERYQHPNTPVHPAAELDEHIEEVKNDVKEVKKRGKADKDNKKTKEKSLKKPAGDSSAGEVDAEAVDDSKSGSGESVKSKDEVEEGGTIEELKEESITAA